MNREKFVETMERCAGAPYQWGGSGPDSFDCSGLVIYGLRNSGMEIPDMTAARLYEHFASKKIVPSTALPGSLYFYGRTATLIDHVMAVLRRWKNGTVVLIGARGGNSATTDLEAAFESRAFVDVVIGGYWQSHFQFAADPFQ